MSPKPTRSEEPQDRLTRLCDAMVSILEAHPEYQEGDKAIIMLQAEKQGGIVMNGYEDDSDAMVDLLMHLEAIFRANGKQLSFLPLETRGRG